MPRSLPWVRRLTALAVGLALALPAFAGTTGKLTGKVTDEKKQPLAGVNIRIEGQRLGAITDDAGEYFIIGIPGGRWAPMFEELATQVAIAPPVRPNPLTQDTLLGLFSGEAVGRHVVLQSATIADMCGTTILEKPSLEVIYEGAA